MRLLLLLTLTFLLHIVPVSAQKTDSLSISSEYGGFVDQLDSLLIDWYRTYSTDSAYQACLTNRSEIITDVPDSIYRYRLAQLSSPVPLDYNPAVQLYLTKYISKGKWFIPDLLGKAQYYFPMFEEILDTYQLPLELKYLTIIESALNPNAVSRAGATGIWQFMLGTARKYNLEINSYVDERRDPYMESIAAARYLKDLYDIYGDWHLAIASYNCGPGTMNNAIRRSGGKTNYWEVSKYLPHETRNYVPAFIAMNYIFNYYHEHNFVPCLSEIPMHVDTVMIRDELHFDKIASVLNIGKEELRLLNPQYRKDFIPAKTRNYPLRLRTELIGVFVALEDSIYRKDSLMYETNPVVFKADDYYVDTYTPAPQPANTEKLIYTVKSGDVLGYISSWYSVSISDIKSWNGIYSNNLQIGQKITIYKPIGVASRYRNIDSMSFVDKQKMSNAGATSSSASTSPVTSPEKIDPNYEYYTVQQGDNPWSIANKFNGVSVDDILKLNNISNPSSLKVGQKIKIRKKA